MEIPDLQKWPAMVVVGEKVTEEQAWEVIIRCDGFFNWPLTNDEEWLRSILTYCGVNYKNDYPNYEYEEFERVRSEIGAISLRYLHNNRISSSWIGGPYGWIDWKGNIFCNNFNIGKWPRCSEVREEWGLIAENFPFISLTCQLMSEESGHNGKPLVEYVVKGGAVIMRKPEKEIVPSVGLGYSDMTSLLSPLGGRGIDFETLCKAIDHVKNKNPERRLA